MKTQINLKYCLVLICSILGLFSCRSLDSTSNQPTVNAPVNFSETDLIGTWQVTYGGSDTDAITIATDGTFRQIFTTPYGYHFEGSPNKWWIEKRPSGCLYLHLLGMRYYAGTIEKAESMAKGVAVHLIEVCEDRVLNVSTELILAVESAADVPRGLRLAQLKPDADTENKYFVLANTLTDTTATP